MNPSDKDRLLREILVEDDQHLAEFRNASLALGLETVRGERRRRLAWKISLVAVLPIALATAFGIRSAHRPLPPFTPPAELVVTPVPASPGVKIISEKELFALFPNRPLALIGKPGQQRLVFLNAETADGDFSAKPPGARLTE